MQCIERRDVSVFYAVNDPDFKAGVASLAQLLQIPPHIDHLIVLKVRVNNVETSYFTQLKICSPNDNLITSWSFTARWSTWPENHLVPCVAELVGSCIPIHAHRCLPDPKCFFYPSGLSLCLSVDHFCLVPVDDMVLFHGIVCNGWLVSYNALPCPGGSGLCTSCKRVYFFLVFLDPQTETIAKRATCENTALFM